MNAATFNPSIKILVPLLICTLYLLGSEIRSSDFEWKGAKYKSGLKYKLYYGEWKSLPDFKNLTPVKTGIVDSFKLDMKDKSNYFGVVFEGYIRLPAGEYIFSLNSDDGSRLFINGKELINYDGLHGMRLAKSGTITLAKGVHSIKVLYFDSTAGEGLKLSCESPYFNKQEVPAKALFHKQ